MLRFAFVLFLAVSVSAFIRPENLFNRIKNRFNGKKVATEVEPQPKIDMSHLYSTYSMRGTPGVDSFFTVPRTLAEAKAEGWVIPEETVGNKLFTTYCEDQNPSVCILLDNKGSIAGYQISVSTEVDNGGIEGFNYPDKGFKTQTLFGNTVYSNQIWFVSQEVIAAGGREFNNQTGDGLWLQIGKDLVQIPLTEDGLEGTKFIKQNCFIRMGQHYFWDVSDDLTPERFMPWFLLFNPEHKLSGFGFISFNAKGDLSKKTGWLENVPGAAIKAIAPGVPSWVLTEGDRIGIRSHHVYWGDKPWEITCSENEVKKYE